MLVWRSFVSGIRSFHLGQRLALLVLALVACLPSIGGQRIGSLGLPAGQREVARRSCCAEADPPACCSEDEEHDSGPVLVPMCCGFDAPPAPYLPDPLPRSCGPDFAERLASALTRALQHVQAIVRRNDGACAAFAAAGLAPPETRGRGPAGIHWWTDRESLAVLALLSIARP